MEKDGKSRNIVERQPTWLRKGFKLDTSGVAYGFTGSATADRNPAEAAARREAAGTAPRQRRYTRRVPLDLRLQHWAAGWIIIAWDTDPENKRWHRWLRARMWAVRLYPRARSFVLALLGPRVEPVAKVARDNACDRCPFVRIVVPASPKGRVRRFCQSCGCPDWPFAELGYKNWLAKWLCPENRHEHVPDWVPTWILQREEAFRDEKRAVI